MGGWADGRMGGWADGRTACRLPAAGCRLPAPSVRTQNVRHAPAQTTRPPTRSAAPVQPRRR
ncbi:hypothetical protein FCH28_04370 [Streptomyces piniterrae]|uniref:Uncharacterized protein n=1 Tax=Streptomyces piniterrae TaxID=2571125 RepID=A0A4U0NQL0_9ACTN|nr:hypothetical protein FCH28_04370 [Streptomyces piniterrae]